MGKNNRNLPRNLVKFQIEQLNNETYLATLFAPSNKSVSIVSKTDQPYDDEGALYYVVAVVFIYGFSIILMIGSLIKKNKNDNGVSKYMKDMDKVRRMERRQLKYQTRLAMSAAEGSRRASRALAAARGSYGGVSDPGNSTPPLSAKPDQNFDESNDLKSTSTPIAVTSGATGNNVLLYAMSQSPFLSTETTDSPLSPYTFIQGKSIPSQAPTEIPDLGTLLSRTDQLLMANSFYEPSKTVDRVSQGASQSTLQRSPLGSTSPGNARRTLYLQPILVCGRPPCNSSPTKDTVLYLGTDEKCQVSLAQQQQKGNAATPSPQRSVSPNSQLGTVQEVEEEHNWSRDGAYGKVQNV